MSNSLNPLQLKFIPQDRPGLFLNARFGGGPEYLLMVDTGSLGINISREVLNDVPHRPLPGPLPPAPISYSSSGNTYGGEWVLVSVEIVGLDGQSFTTAKEIAVFATDQPGVGMMGVSTRFPDPCLLLNPFLNVPGMETGAVRYGYELTKGYVLFGYDDDEVSTFNLRFPISPATGQPMPTATVSLKPANGDEPQPYTNKAPMLVDTGLFYMIITPAAGNVPPAGYEPPPPPPPARAHLYDNMLVTLEVEDEHQQLQTIWEFNTSDCQTNLELPQFVSFATPSPLGIVNTGLHLLNGYDYIVDFTANIVGLRKPPRTS